MVGDSDQVLRATRLYWAGWDGHADAMPIPPLGWLREPGLLGLGATSKIWSQDLCPYALNRLMLSSADTEGCLKGHQLRFDDLQPRLLCQPVQLLPS